ncbi:MAG TPA: glycyl-radical enzyme activating protein [Armatimonadota bacterium]|nr:glycyl-radical enzyme activating protein [Armatimonadota bacterium]
MATTGIVFNIQRFSLHDGPGIRTTVFLKGCPLRCQWCHNPEGLDPRPQLRVTVTLCVLCGKCVHSCAYAAHEITDNRHVLHLQHCRQCGNCVRVCPAGAIEMVGQLHTVEEVMAVVRRDVPFYQQSGGGMTLSGGEPLAQYEFTKALLTTAHEEGIHTALESTACFSWEKLSPLASVVDLFLIDLKHTDNKRHRELTNISNTVILENIRRMVTAGLPVNLRIPWIPTRNAEPEFLEGLVAFLTSLPSIPPVTFLPYHRLGISKWAAIDGESPMPEEIPAAKAEDIAPWVVRLQQAGIDAMISS